MKTSTDAKALLQNHITTKVIVGLSAQSGLFFLTEPSFDSAYAKIDTHLFVHLLRKMTSSAAFASFIQEISEVACRDLAAGPFQLFFQSISQVSQDPQDTTKSKIIDVITYNYLYSSLLPSLPVDVPE